MNVRALILGGRIMIGRLRGPRCRGGMQRRAQSRWPLTCSTCTIDSTPPGLVRPFPKNERKRRENADKFYRLDVTVSCIRIPKLPTQNLTRFTRREFTVLSRPLCAPPRAPPPPLRHFRAQRTAFAHGIDRVRSGAFLHGARGHSCISVTRHPQSLS